jgi:hypothetical protein
MADHLKRGTIQPGDGPYMANIFYIKKKMGSSALYKTTTL